MEQVCRLEVKSFVDSRYLIFTYNSYITKLLSGDYFVHFITSVSSMLSMILWIGFKAKIRIPLFYSGVTTAKTKVLVVVIIMTIIMILRFDNNHHLLRNLSSCGSWTLREGLATLAL